MRSGGGTADAATFGGAPITRIARMHRRRQANAESAAETKRTVEEALALCDDLLRHKEELLRADARMQAIEAELADMHAWFSGGAEAAELADERSAADEHVHADGASAALTRRDDDHRRLEAAQALLAVARSATRLRLHHLERRLAAAHRLGLLPRRLPAARSRRASTRRRSRARARAPDRPPLATDRRTPGGKPGCRSMPTEGKRK
jgi:hypothetical protein